MFTEQASVYWVVALAIFLVFAVAGFAWCAIESHRWGKKRKKAKEASRKNPSSKNPYRKGTCGHCGNHTEVRYDLNERGRKMYWSLSGKSKGGAITICRECEKKYKRCST